MTTFYFGCDFSSLCLPPILLSVDVARFNSECPRAGAYGCWKTPRPTECGDASLKRSMMDQKRGRFVRTMAAITLEQLKDVIVHLSDKEFEELVEAREQAWDRQIETDAEAGKLDQLAEEALRDFREGKCIRLP